MVGELGDVAEAIQPLAQGIGLVDRGLPARAVHLVDREEIDRGPAGEGRARAGRVAVAPWPGTRAGASGGAATAPPISVRRLMPRARASAGAPSRTPPP